MRRYSLALLLLPAVFLASPAAASTKDAAMHYLKALLLSHQGEHEQALAEFEAALELDPQSSFMYQQAAELALETGRTDKALGLAERFVGLSTGNPSAHLLLGNVRWARGDGLGAQEAFEKTIELRPGDKEALFALGSLLSSQSPGKAKDYFTQYLATNPENASEAEFQIALLEQRAGRPEAAAEHLKSSIRFDPDNMQARHALAQVYEVSRDTEAALGAYLEMLGRDPRNTTLLNRVGEIYFAQEDLVRAKEHFQRAKAVQPDHPAACLWLALLSEAQGDFAGAAKSLSESAALKEDPSISLRLSYYFSQAGQTKDAVAALEAARAKWPENGEIAYFLALGYDDLKKTGKAVALIEEVLKAHPDHRDARFQLGAIYERNGRMAEAEAQFREILKLNPADASALNYLGYSLADRSLKLEEARTLIEGAVRLDPKNGAYRDSLGWVLFKQGYFQDAVKELELAARLQPRDETLWDHLGDAYMVLQATGSAWDAWKMAEAYSTEKPPRSEGGSSAAPEKAALAKKAEKAEDLLGAEELGRRTLQVFYKTRGELGTYGGSCLIEGAVAGRKFSYRGILHFRAPNQLSVEVLGPLFASVFRVKLSGEDGFEMDKLPFEGVSDAAARETLLAYLGSLREYLSGRLFSREPALLRKGRRSQTVSAGGFSLVPDETRTRLGSFKSEGEGGFSLSFDKFLAVDGRWVPTSLRFEGRGFSLELRVMEPTIRFL